jgi:hypothetical protein
MPTIDAYLALITAYHRGKPKFSATVSALVDPLAQLQAFLQALPGQFDLDVAIGAQLDVIGIWVGESRYVKTPLQGVYFSFDIEGLGFDQGVWQGPFDPDNGLNRLDDDSYRLLIRAKIAANQWDGTLPQAQQILDTLFAGTGSDVFIQDNQDMTIVIGVSGEIPDAVAQELILGGYLPLKPEGVRVDYMVTSARGPIFGFDVDNRFIGGFDHGAWGLPGPVSPLDSGATWFISVFGPERTIVISDQLHQVVNFDLPAAIGA